MKNIYTNFDGAALTWYQVVVCWMHCPSLILWVYSQSVGGVLNMCFYHSFYFFFIMIELFMKPLWYLCLVPEVGWHSKLVFLEIEIEDVDKSLEVSSWFNWKACASSWKCIEGSYIFCMCVPRFVWRQGQISWLYIGKEGYFDISPKFLCSAMIEQISFFGLDI